MPKGETYEAIFSDDQKMEKRMLNEITESWSLLKLFIFGNSEK